MIDVYNYYLLNTALSYSAVPRFVRREQLQTHTGFQSLYAVDAATAAAIIAAGTTEKFKGVVWTERLWIDVDSYEAGDRVGAKLEAEGYDFIAYDSGGRGMHFGVARTAHPSHLLPAQDKHWVRTTFPEADPSLYTHLHLFRLPNTVHEKTGRLKSLLHTSNGKRCVVLLPLPPRTKISLPSGDAGISIFNCERVIKNSMPAPVGERHAQLTRLVYALRDDACVDISTAMWWTNEVNKLFSEPKSYEELEQLLASIYER